MFKLTRIAMTLSLITLTAVLIGVDTASAEPRHERHGFFVGADLGLAGAGLEFEKGGKSYEYTELEGGTFGLRLGYAINPYISLSIDARGFGHAGDDFDLRYCTRTLNATVYPMGGGFFLRAGLGAAELETELDDDNTDTVIEEFEETGGALALGLGYDWMVNEHFAIGLSIDSRGAAIDDFGDFDEMGVGDGSLGVNMNYYF